MAAFSNKKIKSYLVPGKRVHLVGIGGVSMRPLGLVLQDMGLTVTGSDMNASVSTEELQEKGIQVSIGHQAGNVLGADCVIRTAAAHNDNPEIAAARALGIPVFERAEAWGVLMQSYKNAICISGTHGKTTTTSMVTQILMTADMDPTVMIGGTLPALGAGHRVGKGESIVLESCEYCNSFLNFFPTLAVVLNIEEDHLDFFKDLREIQDSFRQFVQLVPQKTGMVVANGDDYNTVKALEGIDYISFGLTDRNRVHGRGYSSDWRQFTAICDGQEYCRVNLGVYGRHNAANAIAAIAVAWLMGVPGEKVELALSQFHGAGRRMEYKGEYHGAKIYDDYSHHPSELRAAIQTIKTMGFQRLILAFQPHTYTRTKLLFEDFVRELQAADHLVLAEIYAARERNPGRVSSKDLADQIEGAVYFETLPEVTEYLRRIAGPGDVIVTMGAGDIYKAGEALLK